MSANSRGARRIRGKLLAAVEVGLVTFGAVCVGWYSGVRVAASREQALLSRELEAKTLGSLGTAGSSPTIVARIELRRLSLSAVAREGVDARTLEVAVGHVPGTALPGETGNAAFAAHRDTFFRPLRRVHPGDVISVTTPQGGYRYVVTSTRVVNPDDVSVLSPTGESVLTLVTCYPFTYIGNAPYRFIVRAELLSR
jgi:sortase A